MTISVHYHVAIKVPEEVYRKFGETQEYEHRVIDCCGNNIGSGQDSYTNVFEWADFTQREEAEECERKLNELMNEFKSRIE